MQPLPKWVMPSTLPAAYETESVTALEGVIRLHGTVRKLIDEYNKLTDELQKDIAEYEASSSKEIQSFKDAMGHRLACKFKDLTAIVNEAKTELTKFATEWLQENTPAGVLPVITEADNGKILIAKDGAWVPYFPAAAFSYDPATESLVFNTIGGDQ